jgi:hypothetical protein
VLMMLVCVLLDFEHGLVSRCLRPVLVKFEKYRFLHTVALPRGVVDAQLDNRAHRQRRPMVKHSSGSLLDRLSLPGGARTQKDRFHGLK